MIIECTDCGAENEVIRLPQPGKRYRCGKCGASITFAEAIDAQANLEEVPKKKAIRKTTLYLLWALFLVLLVPILIGAYDQISEPAPEPAPASVQQPRPPSVVPPPAPTPETFSTGDVVMRVSSAVVLIMTDDGSGTGMFISSDGYVLTNEHVVRESHYATLNLPDKRSIQSEVVYRDRATARALSSDASGTPSRGTAEGDSNSPAFRSHSGGDPADRSLRGSAPGP